MTLIRELRSRRQAHVKEPGPLQEAGLVLLLMSSIFSVPLVIAAIGAFIH